MQDSDPSEPGLGTTVLKHLVDNKNVLVGCHFSGSLLSAGGLSKLRSSTLEGKIKPVIWSWDELEDKSS